MTTRISPGDAAWQAYTTAQGDERDQWRALVLRSADLVQEYGHLPATLAAYLPKLIALWRSGEPDREVLAHTKRECWTFLKTKHGNSVDILDCEDRAVRAMLCLVEPAGDRQYASDTASCLDDMLTKSPPL